MSHRRPPTAKPLIVALLAGLLPWWACGPPPEPGPAQRAAARGSIIDLIALHRLTDPAYPQRAETCRRALEERRETVRDFGFEGAGGLAGWRVDTPGWRLADGTLRARTSGGRFTMTHEPAFDASRVQRLSLRLRKQQTEATGRIVVSWAGPGAPFDEQRRLGVPLRRDGAWNEYALELGDHPEWGGGIVGLRVEFREAGPEVALDSLVFEGGMSREEERMLRVEAGLDGGRLPVNDETRPALRVTPGHDAEVPLVLPAAAAGGEGPSLVFGLGISRRGWVRGGNPVRFRVRLHRRWGGPATLIFDEILDPSGAIEHRGWQDRRVGLGPWAGEAVRLTFSVEDLEHDGGPGTGAFAVWAHPMVMGPAPRSTSVLVVLVDTLRADHVSGCGYPGRTTPNLDRRARRGALFRDLVSTSCWTAPAVASLFTGLQPYRHGVRSQHTLGLGHGLRTLAERFRDRGYVTGAVSDNLIIIADNGYDQGFHSFLGHPWDRLERGAGGMTDKALEWLERHGDRPFFLYLHYMDPHGPYEPRPPFHPGEPGEAAGVRDFIRRGDCGGATRRSRTEPGFRLTPAEDRHLVELYDGEIAQADFHLARLLARMERSGLLERTAVVFLADHGEGFGEHGVWSHGHTLHDEEVLVPLVVMARGDHRVPRGERVPGSARMVDVAPTILDLAGLPADEGMAGRSLLTPAGADAEPPAAEAFSENALYAGPDVTGAVDSALRRGTMKLMLDADGRYRLYDLAADPREQVDIHADGDARAAELARRLDRYLEEAAEAGAGGGDLLDAEQARRLEALGYVE